MIGSLLRAQGLGEVVHQRSMTAAFPGPGDCMDGGALGGEVRWGARCLVSDGPAVTGKASSARAVPLATDAFRTR